MDPSDFFVKGLTCLLSSNMFYLAVRTHTSACVYPLMYILR